MTTMWRKSPGAQVQAAREQTIDFYGVEVTFEAAVRQVRQQGEGFMRKMAETYGPFTVYAYWAGGGGNGDRGNQGDDVTRQDRDGTWGASIKLADGDVLWPTGRIDAVSQYEFVYPGYGRFRVERVQQMVIQGQNVGYQVGLTRVS
jgi:hypothetical protein